MESKQSQQSHPRLTSASPSSASPTMRLRKPTAPSGANCSPRSPTRTPCRRSPPLPKSQARRVKWEVLLMAPRKRGGGRSLARSRLRAKSGPSQIRQTPSPTSTRIIRRAQRLVDMAATLAFDLAAVAAASGRAPHARAVVHALDSAHAAWRTADTIFAWVLVVCGSAGATSGSAWSNGSGQVVPARRRSGRIGHPRARRW